MKSFCWRSFVGATLILLTFALESSVHAQPTDQDSAVGPSQPVPTAVQANEAQIPASGEATVQPARNFSGRIVKENGEFVLQNPVTKVSHKLSDESKAKKYLNQRVKITGKLDKNTNTIQIESIGPAS
jgi:uncharacterized protein YdeI (BOF family)